MRPFSVLIKPASADCNLTCEYCFYTSKSALYPETARHRMSTEVLERMLRSYFEAPQREFACAWQGGEPTLMGREFFETVVERQKALAPPRSTVTNSLQTNGTLIDDAFAAFLAEHGFLVGISIDGPEHVHDRYRRTRAGSGSHTQVLRGLEALQRHGVDYNVLTLVTQANVGEPRLVYKHLTGLGARYHQYIPCVEYRADGSLADFSITGEEWGSFLTGLFDAWIAEDAATVSIRFFDSILEKLLTGHGGLCYMGKDCRHYFVVEHSGDIYPCDFYVESELRLGNVATHRLTELWRAAAYREFGRAKRHWAPGCDACAYLAYCAGDCPKMRGAAGDDAGRSVLCDGWRRFYAHALPRLEELATDLRAGRVRRQMG
jgi:uncharacterized protein